MNVRRYLHAFALSIPITIASAVAAMSAPQAMAVNSDAEPSNPASGTILGATPLGVNVGPSEKPDSDPVARGRIETRMKALGGPTWFRYGGGAWSDAYDWQTNVDTYAASQQRHQSNDFTLGSRYASNALDYTDFPSYMDEVRATGARGMVTINYGSGTPQLGAAWASWILAHHAPVTQFNIGNEPYGCGEVNFPITGPPTNYPWEPNTTYGCPQYTMGSIPGMQLIAQSFIAHAPAFMNAIKQADPAAQIVLPYAISPPGNSGYVWNDAVMPALANYYQGIDIIWYPSFTTVQAPDSTILGYLTEIPDRAAAIKADLNQYAPGKFWMIGETNSSNQATFTPDRPVGAVFAAGDALSWLAQGAATVDWWSQADAQNSGSSLANPSYSLFNGSGNPQPPYWGWLLASKLAQPGALLSADTANTNGNVLAFRSTLANGHHAEAYVDISTTASDTITSALGSKPGRLTEWQYSNQNPAVVKEAIKPARHLTVPPESVTVLER
jgi:hypothetical protein